MNCSQCGTELHGSYCSDCGHFSTEPPAVRSDVKLAGWWLRVGATVVDDAILFVPSLLVALVVGGWSGSLLGVAIDGLYMVKLLSSPSGQTIGNRVVRTQVRDALTGSIITTRQSLKRWLFVALYSIFIVANIPGLTLSVSMLGLIDCLFPLFNERKQTLHDRFARTIVVLR